MTAANLHLARTVSSVIGIGLVAAWVTQQVSDARHVRDELAQCVDLLQLEADANGICLDVLGSCVANVGDLVDAREIGASLGDP